VWRVLARFDIFLLLPAIALDIVWCNFKKIEFKDIAKNVFLTASFAVVVTLPWLAYNMILGKTFLPNSGQAVRFVSLASGFKFLTYKAVYFDIGHPPFIYYWQTAQLAVKEIFSLLNDVFSLVVGGVLFVSWMWLDFRGFLREGKKTLFLFTFLLFIYCAYSFYIFGQWYFFRYFIPFAAGYLLLLILAMNNIREAAIVRKRYAFPNYFKLLLLLVVIPLLIFKSTSVVYESCVNKRISGFYEMVDWVNSNTEKNAIIGSFASGIFGYYSERKFYSLDGKTNHDAFVALKEKKIDDYIKEKKIDYIIEWAGYLNDLCVSRARDKGYLEKQRLLFKSQPNSFREYWTAYKIRT
jgi:hypothetical protein